MNHPRRLAFLTLLLLVVGLGPGAPACLAQASNEDARFLLADTTLVRDTLGLTFERLFPLADSLRMTPNRLRDLSVTYRWSLARLVKMADSLDVPVDSVGPIMLREQFNPLAASAFVNRLEYTSTYFRNRESSRWGNFTQYSINRGGTYATNRLSVDFDRFTGRQSQSRRRVRSSETEVGWKVTPRISVGGTAKLSGFDNSTSSGVGEEEDRTTEFGGTFNARPRPFRGFTASMNASGGTLNNSKIEAQKNGPSAQTNGQLRYAYGTWLSSDLRFGGNAAITKARAEDPSNVDLVFPTVRSRDNSTNLSGTLSLFRTRPAEFLMNYRLLNTRTQRPVAVLPGAAGNAEPLTLKQLVRTASRNVDATARLQQSADRTLSVGVTSSFNDVASASDIRTNNIRERNGFVSNGRFRYANIDLEGAFNMDKVISKFPRRDTTGGFRDDTRNRSLNGKMTWPFMRRGTLIFEGTISLAQSRYTRIDSPLTIPVPHDNASQSYRAFFNFELPARGSTNLNLEVRKNRLVNIPSASTASNNQTRTYSAQWTWTYLILPGLTATQINQMNADYVSYPFSPASNRLVLSYRTNTTLDAALTPRMSLRIDHLAQTQPSGNYRPQTAGDPTEYFSLADESRNYTLRAAYTWTPIPAISLALRPDYQAADRDATVNGQLSPQRRSRRLAMNGDVSLNVAVGATGRLTGTVTRTFDSNRTVSYGTNGVTVSPLAETSNWAMNLNLTWSL